MSYRVLNTTRGTLLAEQAAVARTFASRFLGLMGRKDLPVGEGLHIVPCNSIHTFFMRIPIDALFLSRDGQAVRVVGALPPWRALLPVRGAHSVLELPAGTLAASGTREGDSVRFESDRGRTSPPPSEASHARDL